MYQIIALLIFYILIESMKILYIKFIIVIEIKSLHLKNNK